MIGRKINHEQYGYCEIVDKYSDFTKVVEFKENVNGDFISRTKKYMPCDFYLLFNKEKGITHHVRCATIFKHLEKI